jgi:hypothetical protein
MLSPCGSSRSNPHSLNLHPHEHWRALRVLGVDVFSNLNCSHAQISFKQRMFADLPTYPSFTYSPSSVRLAFYRSRTAGGGRRCVRRVSPEVLQGFSQRARMAIVLS